LTHHFDEKLSIYEMALPQWKRRTAVYRRLAEPIIWQVCCPDNDGGLRTRRIQEVCMTAKRHFDRSAQKTNLWLRDAKTCLDWTDSQRAYTALRAVLHALRDRLPLAEVAHLGAELPTFIRGMYFEGWTPAHAPLNDRRKEEFLAEIQSAFKPRADVDATHVARAIIRLLLAHISAGEMEQIRNAVPHDIRQFWPEATQCRTAC
jgi:uncharacterized protein (DUF2267 family)